MYNIKNIRGMDFSELAETFGIRHSDDENEYNKNIRAFIKDNIDNKDVINVIRFFVNRLVQNDNITYKKPVWKGLSKVKDDCTFISFVIDLLEYMWI